MFVHVTVVPADTVKVAGEKARLAMETDWLAGVVEGGWVVGGVDVGG